MRSFFCFFIWLSVFSVSAYSLEQQVTDLVPEKDITSLHKEFLKSKEKNNSRTKSRVASKRVVRKGQSILKKFPKASNRFYVLNIMRQAQLICLNLELNDKNRGILFDICTQMSRAPDELAQLRFKSDMVLVEHALAEKVSEAEQIEVLNDLISKYRDSKAEKESLIFTAITAKRLSYRGLSWQIENLMNERFSDNAEMIALRRKYFGLNTVTARFSGTYKRADGAQLVLPGDRFAHLMIVVYWSKNSEGYENYLKQVEEQSKRFPGIFEIYSFNIDKLNDAGEEILKSHGLNWNAMHLPEGEKSLSYRSYGSRNPIAIVVNGFGYMYLRPLVARSDSSVGVHHLASLDFKISDMRVSHPRYLAQMQSLFIADHLVGDTEENFEYNLSPEIKMFYGNEPVPSDVKLKVTEQSVPNVTIQAIQRCFTAMPFRYRQTSANTQQSYNKVLELSRIAVEEYPKAPNLWLVKNRKIIALLGLWNVSSQTKYLKEAVLESRSVLEGNAPLAGKLVAKYCLSIDAIRENNDESEKVLESLSSFFGGEKAPAVVDACLLILSLYVNKKDVYQKSKEKLLHPLNEKHSLLWPVLSFLRDKYHQLHVFKPNFTRIDRVWTRWYIVGHGIAENVKPMPKLDLKTLNGKAYDLLDNAKDQQTILLFIEPPAELNADFPVVLDRNGKPTKNDFVRGVIKYSTDLTNDHLKKGARLVLAFLTDNASQVKELMKKNEWQCEAVIVPNGLSNPMVKQLGIFSADKMPNSYLLNPKGEVVWKTSGLVYKSEFGYPFACLLALKVHLEIADLEASAIAFEQKDYTKALKYAGATFKAKHPDRYRWRSPKYHAEALAHLGLKNYEEALESIDLAIDSHKLRHWRNMRRSKRAEDWRKDAGILKIENHCDIIKNFWITKAKVLKHLGRNSEATQCLNQAEKATAIDGEDIYKLYHKKLDRFQKEIFKN